MRRRIVSLLRRLGVLTYPPYICRSCGFTVPVVGTRWEQAGVAVDHWDANHADPKFLPFECAHCTEPIKVGGGCGCATLEGQDDA